MSAPGLAERAALALVLAALPAVAAAEARPIGNVAAANQEVRGTPPGGAPRGLNLGMEVVAEERVETSPLGAGQFLFLDRTALNVWPNSDIVLDRYVYDPDRGVGEIAISVSRGLLRFIGGSISKTSDVSIRTPHALIAVRGGIAMIEVGEDFTRATHVAGAYTRINGLGLARAGGTGEARAGRPGEAEYLGVLAPEAVRDTFGRPLGEGTGGLSSAPEPGLVDGLVATSGLADAGSGAPGAPTAPRLSTFGETEAGTEADATEADPRTGSVAVAAAAAEAGPPPGEVGDEPPPPPPPPPPDVTPIPGASGAARTSYDSDAHPGAASPGSALLPVRAGNAAAFDRMFEERRADGRPGVRATAPSGSTFGNPVDEPSPRTLLVRLSDFGPPGAREPASQTYFNDLGVFHLAAYRTLAGEPAVSLQFFGTPAPADVWGPSSGPDVGVRFYDLSTDLFSLLGAPFGETVGEAFSDDAGSDLMLIPQPGGPTLAPLTPFPGTEAAGPKWLATYFDLEGRGLSQTSALGVFTSRAIETETGAPQTLGRFSATARIDALDAGVSLRTPYGLIDDGAANTAFGPGGEYLVLGQGGRFRAADPETTVPARLRGELSGSPVDIAFGDTRLAVLDRIETLPLAGRAGIATQTETGFIGGPDDSYLTGGFAVVQAASASSGAHLLGVGDAADVRFRFNPSINAAWAEFDDLSAYGSDAEGTALNGLSLSFGTAGSRSAMLTDNLFAMQENFNPEGRVTGSPLRAPDAELAPDDTTFAGNPAVGVRQTAFVGALASADLVGDAGIRATYGAPEWLRWGWWGGEISYDPDFREEPDLLHLGTWVAGVRATLGEVAATTGTASYGGFAIGHVVEALPDGREAAYVEAGRFDMTYDFGLRQGTATITGVLDRTLTSTVGGAAAGGADHFRGSISAGSGGYVDGAFFRGGGDPTAATAGTFGVTGLPGLGGGTADVLGIFAADKATSVDQ